MKTTKLLPANTTPAMLELYGLLLKSEKFLNWKPDQGKPGPMRPQDPAVSVEEKHFTPQQLADAWGVSVQMVREIFYAEEGVLKLGSDGTRTRRRYKTLRIPKEVAERVHRRLSA
jgi:hypothetical protein